jgi:hypothetical protein
VAVAQACTRQACGAAHDERANGERLVAASAPPGAAPLSPPGRGACVK